MNCLGLLTAGTYVTTLFEPKTTYTVPDGWQNFEDTPGNFLLVAPGFSLAGVNAGGSDFIGIYTSIRAESRKCSNESEAASDEPGVARTPEAMAAEFAERQGLVTTQPKAASVGGLNGLVLDIHMADGWKGTCFYSSGAPVVQLIGGAAPSGLDHGIGPGQTMRLYLLKRGDATLAIEVDDYSSGSHLDTYSSLIQQIRFAA